MELSRTGMTGVHLGNQEKCETDRWVVLAELGCLMPAELWRDENVSHHTSIDTFCISFDCALGQRRETPHVIKSFVPIDSWRSVKGGGKVGLRH